jgi:predicted hydrolase (HD superfamily)
LTYYRTASLTALREHVHHEHLIAPMVAAGAVMQAIARDKGEDEEVWGLTAESVLKRFKEKRFAAGVIREQILQCEGIGYSPAVFVQLSLEAMRAVRGELGL